jgi:hypothetical protein
MVAGGVPERKVISMEWSNFGVERSLGALNGEGGSGLRVECSSGEEGLPRVIGCLAHL